MDTDYTAIIDNAMAERESNAVIQGIFSTAMENDIKSPQETNGLDSILPSCAAVTIDTGSSNKSIIIDFGNTPCKCSKWDGRYRQGKIIASWFGSYRDSATLISIQTDSNYYSGNDAGAMSKFEYLKTVKNLGRNPQGNLHYAVNVISAIVTLPDGKLIIWNSQRDREWIAGENTFFLFDDQYSVSGAASGTDRNGNPFSVSITKPLIVKFFCAWIVQGSLEIVRSNFDPVILDYGNGLCDSKATIEINGSVIEIELN